MDDLAKEIIRLSERCCSTPVLIVPKFLQLRPAFFAGLSKSLLQQSDRDLRVDWLRPCASLRERLGDVLARVEALRINQALAKISSRYGDCGPRGQLTVASGMASRTATTRRRIAYLEITAMIGRPGGIQRELVLGLADPSCPLSAWCTPIHLDAHPESQAICGVTASGSVRLENPPPRLAA